MLSTLKALRYNSYCNLEQKQVFINLRHQVTCHIQVFINILLRHQVICSGNLIIQLNSFYFIYICTFEAWQYSLSNGVSRRDYIWWKQILRLTSDCGKCFQHFYLFFVLFSVIFDIFSHENVFLYIQVAMPMTVQCVHCMHFRSWMLFSLLFKKLIYALNVLH